MRDCRRADVKVNAPLDNRAVGARNRCVHNTDAVLRAALHKRKILPLYPFFPEVNRQYPRSMRVFCNKNKPARILIKPVYGRTAQSSPFCRK